MEHAKTYVAIGLFGAVGAVARLLLGYLATPLSEGSTFPWATLICNLLGCLLLGWLTAFAPMNKQWLKTALGTGLIGSFTTFSAFSVETVQLFELKEWNVFICYFLASYVGGLLLVWTGYSLRKAGTSK